MQIQYKEATQFILRIAEYDSKISFEEIKKWMGDKCLQIEVILN